MKALLIYLLLFNSASCVAQYEDFFKPIIGRSNLFKRIKSKLTPNQIMLTKDGKNTKRIICSYTLNNSTVPLEYFYPQSANDSSCSYIIINKSRINLRGQYEYNFACDLDVNSFELYKGNFNRRNYILLTCINTGSGSFTTTIICHLFDVTDKNAIKYYPLWSKYGGPSSLGDFNNDGKLDFLKVKNIDGVSSRLRLSIETLDKTGFIPFKNDAYFINLELTDDGKYKILNKKWLK